MELDLIACPSCKAPTERRIVDEAHQYAFWKQKEGACPACVQQHLLQTLLDEGHAAFHDSVQIAWPLDAEAAFGALPTPLRLHADPRYAGRGVTIAIVDAGFYPHADITLPVNRIRAWVDAGSEPCTVIHFTPVDLPRWPGWDEGHPGQWHGLMTSVAAAGNGMLSHGLYRGLASESEVVLIQVRDERGRITDETIQRALKWLLDNREMLGVRIVNLSVAGDGDPDSQVDEAVAALVAAGVVVVAAAGNQGVRSLVPPATAPHALTIGGIDDHNTFDHEAVMLWHSNYGQASNGALKPELVAPSIWVAAPLLPGTTTAEEARRLFERRDAENEARIAQLKLISLHYQHVDGTSFAAPLVASAVACMLEANQSLTPNLVRDALQDAACVVAGVSRERQGAGALDAGRAVALALQEMHGLLSPSPEIRPEGVSFGLHDHHAGKVQVLGSWNGWQNPGLIAAQKEAGLWKTPFHPLPPGSYNYKFLIDGNRWLDDPANQHKVPDGLGGLNSVFSV